MGNVLSDHNAMPGDLVQVTGYFQAELPGGLAVLHPSAASVLKEGFAENHMIVVIDPESTLLNQVGKIQFVISHTYNTATAYTRTDPQPEAIRVLFNTDGGEDLCVNLKYGTFRRATVAEIHQAHIKHQKMRGERAKVEKKAAFEAALAQMSREEIRAAIATMLELPAMK